MSAKLERLRRMEALRAGILEFVRGNPDCFFIQIKHGVAVASELDARTIAGAVSSMVKAGELVAHGEIRNEKRFRAEAEATASAEEKLATRRKIDSACSARYKKRARAKRRAEAAAGERPRVVALLMPAAPSDPANKRSTRASDDEAMPVYATQAKHYPGPRVDPARPWVTIHSEGDTAPAADSRGQGAARRRATVNCFQNY